MIAAEEKIEYETRYIAFLDILGFRQLVMGSVASEASFQSLFGALRVWHRYIDDTRRLDTLILQRNAKTRARAKSRGTELLDSPDNDDFALEYVYFSDTLVVSARRSARGLAALLNAATMFCFTHLSFGMLIRGGISLGPLWHRGGIIVGPAFVDAYELESTQAKYPRILFTSQVVSDVQSHSTEGASFDAYVREDFDGWSHLDVLRGARLHMGYGNDERTAYIAAASRIKDGFASSASDGVRAKYGWYRKYYNEFAQGSGLGLDKL